MKYGKVRELDEGLDILIKYSRDHFIEDTHFNILLSKNSRLFKNEVKIINENISKELKDLQAKALKLAFEVIKPMTEEEKKAIKDPFPLGYAQLTEEEKKKHDKLYASFIQFLSNESDIKFIEIKKEVYENVGLTYDYAEILADFVIMKPV